MLELHDVHAYYGNIHALKGLALWVGQGEIVTLIGANGAGKSTTIRTITGLLRPRHGQITLTGERIERLPPHLIVQRGVAQAPEGRRIFPRLTVTENLRFDQQGGFIVAGWEENAAVLSIPTAPAPGGSAPAPSDAAPPAGE